MLRGPKCIYVCLYLQQVQLLEFFLSVALIKFAISCHLIRALGEELLMIASENNLQTTDCPDMSKNIYPQYVKNSPEAHVYLSLCIMSPLLFRAK